MGKSTPAPVDYTGAAEQEAESARQLTDQQTWANRPNQVTPWGQQVWSAQGGTDPATGNPITQWTQTQQLSEPLQAMLDSQMGLSLGRSSLGYGMLGNVANEMGNPMDWSKYGEMQMINPQQQIGNQNVPDLWGTTQWDMPQYNTTGTLDQLNFQGAPDVTNPQFGVQKAEDAIYGKAKSRLDQQFDSQRQKMEIKLRNQGLSPGDQAYQSAMQNIDIQANDAYGQATMDSIIGAGKEAQRMFGMESDLRNQYTGEVERAGMFGNQAAQQEFEQQMAAGSQAFQDVQTAANQQNQARSQAMNERQNMLAYNQDLDFRMADYWNNLRQQAINEEMTRRGQSLNEANALIAGQQVGQPQFSGFQSAGVAQAPQYLQAAGMTGQQNAANASAENAMWNSLYSGLGSAAGAAGMFSDRRLKRKINKIGEHNGVNWYEFEYVWGEQAVGVMADEVPHAAFEHPSGFLMVDYSRV